MTSSNGYVFRVTGPLCGEFTGQRWIPRTKASDAELWCFLWSAPCTNGWVNNREPGDLRRQRAHHAVIVMCMFSLLYLPLSVTSVIHMIPHQPLLVQHRHAHRIWTNKRHTTRCLIWVPWSCYNDNLFKQLVNILLVIPLIHYQVSWSSCKRTVLYPLPSILSLIPLMHQRPLLHRTPPSLSSVSRKPKFCMLAEPIRDDVTL